MRKYSRLLMDRARELEVRHNNQSISHHWANQAPWNLWNVDVNFCKLVNACEFWETGFLATTYEWLFNFQRAWSMDQQATLNDFHKQRLNIIYRKYYTAGRDHHLRLPASRLWMDYRELERSRWYSEARRCLSSFLVLVRDFIRDWRACWSSGEPILEPGGDDSGEEVGETNEFLLAILYLIWEVFSLIWANSRQIRDCFRVTAIAFNVTRDGTSRMSGAYKAHEGGQNVVACVAARECTFCVAREIRWCRVFLLFKPKSILARK